METTQSTLTFTEAVNQWLVTHSAGRKPRTKEFNQEIADTVLDNWHEPNIEAKAVSMDDVLFFSEKVTRYCPTRWNAIVSCLRSVTPHGRILKRRRVRVRKFDPPNQMQFDAFLVECDAARKGCHVGLIVRFLCWTGMRITEAKLLRWRDVSEARINVPGHVTKSGEPRSIPIFSGLSETLARLRAVTFHTENDFVLPEGNPRKAIESACRRAGLPLMSPHCFRHYFATRCVESQVDARTLALWLGHQDRGELALKTYFHLRDDHIRAQAEKVRIAA